MRIGRHADFLASMQARLSTHRFEDGTAPLLRLRTRELDDLTISLLDAFAAAGDVLTFYNERVANEGYLPTATEYRSVGALAGLVGYRPQPGVAASVFLAFGIDPNIAGPMRIDKGLGVKTVPGQDELPQVFETSDPLEARAAWNRLRLRRSRPQRVADLQGDRRLWLAGTDTRLAIGDVLLIGTGAEMPEPARVIEVAANAAAGRTMVRFEFWPRALDDPKFAGLIEEGRQFGGANAPAVLRAVREVQGLPLDEAAGPLQALVRDARERAERLAGQPEIRDLLLRIAERADDLVQEIAALAASPDERLPDGGGSPGSFGDKDWLEVLSAPPSTAPPNAASLPQSTTLSFGATSAASLKVVGKAAPAIADRLGRALAGYTGAAPPSVLTIAVMRVRAGLFGRTFPKRMRTLREDDGIGALVEIGEWPIVTGRDEDGLTGRERTDVIALDAVYDGIAQDGWVVVDMSGLAQPGDGSVRVGPTAGLLVTRTSRVSAKSARADYGGSGETTLLHLDKPWISYAALQDGGDLAFAARDLQPMIDREFQLIRHTTVHAAPEPLTLAERPIEGDFCLGGGSGYEVELDGYYDRLEPGRYLIVSGERADIPATEGVMASEVAMIAGVSQDVGRSADLKRTALVGERNHTFLTLADALAYCYRRDTVVIHGNVVKATHGERRREPLGGGNAAKPNQKIALKQFPLTFLAAATARGAEAALEVRVDDILWHEAEDLVDAGPTDRLYVLRTAEDGKAEVQFGDGAEGARPPTGTQNIDAVYRTGIGRAGNAGAGQISQLVSRPQGLRDVVNPLPASGGADPESRDQVRRNAPLMTMALDRLVSVEDHASFARSFAGIAKARARMMTDVARRFVHLTVAGEDDAPVGETSDLMVALKRALLRYGDPFSPVRVAPRELRLLIVSARIAVEPDRLWEAVVTEVRRRLVARFSFDRRDIAQGLGASELVAVIQATPGVAYVDLDTFGSIPTLDGPADARAPLPPAGIAAEIARVTEEGVSGWETARPARPAKGGILAAELLLLAPDVPDTLILNELKRDAR